MKPFIENIRHTSNFNWLVKHFRSPVPKLEYACAWHYHAEYELVLYLDPQRVFEGNYFAGDSIGKINHQSMFLYGPGLPHMLAGRLSGVEESAHHTVVIWLKHQWLERIQELIPEARELKRLLNDSAYGIEFSKEVAEKVSVLVDHFDDLPPQRQVLKVIDIIMLLLEDDNKRRLSASPYYLHQFKDDKESYLRIEEARKYIETHYHQPIKVSDLCQLLHMSESSIYRMYEKHYGVSFSEHLKQYRIGKACELLASSTKPVSLVAELTGFQNLSNFNRQFRAMKSTTPSAFRKQFKPV
ncbi:MULTISPECIES: AraC family transcriptional regulator [Vibrio]|uniref:AraC family transcriptional regulator n=1 Tax=Vibrio TaxID=662 RepID=UPI002075EEE9|nr:MULTISPECIES: AraC family transcriptional regulator [Vibrio]USD35132.1 helix-turn-helix domain-containing protein [Vibrio sp. SCSIO 43186]USD48197.1 helix-turn-helix domain-containing protein [Vibrio sp. SCSIO 43145]USD72257.1 helix-turn-helix domain-containing protein [Vibrio sp. SCSIO 43139]USD97932.1 AraC family transcriptional regulator [Vibrio coralliilyticus]